MNFYISSAELGILAVAKNRQCTFLRKFIFEQSLVFLDVAKNRRWTIWVYIPSQVEYSHLC